MKNTDEQIVIGIDEVGRGPLAGPMVVAGVCVAESPQNKYFFQGIRDSKKLSARKREEWFEKINANKSITYATATIAPAVIDRINIWHAAQRGARLVFKKLAGGDMRRLHVMLDGSLYLPREISQETIIKGDEKVPLIAAASIVAKVTRDRMMLRLDKKFPEYGFARHKGYGTALHTTRIRAHGLSPIHRISFCKKFL